MASYLGIELFLGSKQLSELHHWLIPNEFWKPIEGFEDYYLLSTMGRVISLERKVRIGNGATRINPRRFIKTPANGNGYTSFKAYADNKKKSLEIHRILALNFIPNPLNKPQVNHKNLVRHHSYIMNLEWNTVSENAFHKYRVGTASCKGVKNSNCKMTLKQVLIIKMLLQIGIRVREISKQFPVNEGTVSKIKTGRLWGHINI